ncbi:hypothetical protein L6164_024578 [Bauhinia variegata]|uniref:Uncharacterized protein n=1 Tax=Bauhinia variegata TaxID=167791 RepID=A0ACB9LY84_BAUVA|nr:hypothetical protein L6164_024578 [Bauhinia variegata]
MRLRLFIVSVSQCNAQDEVALTLESSMASQRSPQDNVVYVEPEYCPQAVLDWYSLTGGDDEYKRHTRNAMASSSKSTLTLKAKKHLSALGWVFWLADKNGRKELRYKSPINGKNYYSLKTACKSLIEEGTILIGSESESITPNHESLPQITPAPQDEGFSIKKVSSCSENHTNLQAPAITQQQRRGRKRKAEPLSGNECSMGGLSHSQNQLNDLTCVGGGKRGRHMRSSKRVRRWVFSWLIDQKVVLPRAKVSCRGKNNQVKEGRLFSQGIECDCCWKMFTLTGFEAHAGSTKHRPAASIFLEDGRLLSDCQKEASQNNKTKGLNTKARRNGLINENMKTVQNDSICSVCHNEGELILCDRCPSSFHLSCLGLKELPDGDWFCPSCCCKICSHYSCKHVNADSVNNSFLVCDQCEHKYHIGCLKIKGLAELNEIENENWLCSRECENIFYGLQKLIGKPIPVAGQNLSLTLLKTMKSQSSADVNCDPNALALIDSKLRVALELMHECFEPVIEAFNGKDLVEEVIFSKSSELGRLNFKGFYTAVLEKNDEVVTAATVRIFGQKVAEVPLVATKFEFRRLGMCSALMRELEKKLIEFGVERLTLPAVHSMLETWTSSFGFAKMTDHERSLFLDYPFLVFGDTIMCQKLLEKPSMEERTAKPSIDLQQNHFMSTSESCITEICY